MELGCSFAKIYFVGAYGSGCAGLTGVWVVLQGSGFGGRGDDLRGWGFQEQKGQDRWQPSELFCVWQSR